MVDMKSLNIYSDSNLLVQRMNNDYDVRDTTLKKYVDIAKNLSKAFEQLTVAKVSRALNVEVDALTKADRYHK